MYPQKCLRCIEKSLECSKPSRTDPYRKGTSHDVIVEDPFEPDHNPSHELGSFELVSTSVDRVLAQGISEATAQQREWTPLSELEIPEASSPSQIERLTYGAGYEHSPYLNKDYAPIVHGRPIGPVREQTILPSIRQSLNTATRRVISSEAAESHIVPEPTQSASGVPAFQSSHKMDAYTVSLICSTVTQYVALQAFLDETHDKPVFVDPEDPNDHTLGRFGNHNVVITLSFSRHVTNMMIASFPNIKCFLSVGIGGGVPSEKHDIRLGDVVVGGLGSVGALVTSGWFHLTRTPIGVFCARGVFKAPPALLSAVSGLMAQYELGGNNLGESIADVLQRMPKLQKKFALPDPKTDRLYNRDFGLRDRNEPCFVLCGELMLINRNPRPMDEQGPMIHHGLIASSASEVRIAQDRDQVAARYGLLCFDNEAADLLENFNGLAIRGICDYSDSHKNTTWQGYAAMAAAAYARDLLHRLPAHKQGPAT